LGKIRIVNAHGGGEGHKLAAHADAAQIAPSADFGLAGNPVATQGDNQQQGKTNGTFFHGVTG
jgi:hypothetical protein